MASSSVTLEYVSRSNQETISSVKKNSHTCNLRLLQWPPTMVPHMFPFPTKNFTLRLWQKFALWFSMTRTMTKVVVMVVVVLTTVTYHTVVHDLVPIFAGDNTKQQHNGVQCSLEVSLSGHKHDTHWLTPLTPCSAAIRLYVNLIMNCCCQQ